jgi:TPR repeat protein
MYAFGAGVAQNYVQAHKWFNLAAARFPASETEKRDLAVKSRDIVAAKMTPAQIAKAQKLAREWKPK